MQTVLLINPPRSPWNAILDHAPAEAKPFIHRKLIGPPLGLLTLAARFEPGRVALLDMKAEYDMNPGAPPPESMVRQWMERIRPSVVGVTFIASEFTAGLRILRTVRECDPGVVTVAGGLHATLCPRDFDDPAVDFVCAGPGAESFRRFVATVDAGRGGEPPLPGIWRRTAGGLFPPAEPAPDINPAGPGFIPPERSLVRRWLSAYVVGKAPGPSTYVFTSLGCPYRCSFCSIWPQYGGRYWQRDVAGIVAELGTLQDYDVVRFADANTLVHVEFAERLFDAIAAAGVRKTFIMDLRADTAAEHPQLVARMARGGLKVVITGFESFRQRELDAYGKQLDVRRIDEGIRIFSDNGILVRGNYIVPPDYDRDDFDALADFASARPVELAGYTVLTPMPGTDFHDAMRDRIADPDLDRYNLFNCVLKTRLPLDEFHARVGALWTIRKGTAMV